VKIKKIIHNDNNYFLDKGGHVRVSEHPVQDIEVVFVATMEEEERCNSVITYFYLRI